ncbi:hypothetical protein M3Y98_00023200 [Aphelenchoides besseyi]|nr:hypothetical protein M3Y98_00023200 [Aphelenchoides besseyi]
MRNKTRKVVENDPNDFHFLFLLVNSLGRTQFLRHMEQTAEFLDDHKAAFMNNFAMTQKDGTFDLTSLLGSETANSIVDRLKYKNYVTMLNHDSHSKNAQFSETKFLDYDFDFDFRPQTSNPNRSHCENDNRIDSTIKLMGEFSSVFARQPHFSVNFIGSAQYATNLEKMDELLLNELKKMESRNAWNQTVFVLAGTSVQTNQHLVHSGRVEQLNPLLAIRLPPKFCEIYREKCLMLEANENRLITDADLRATIHDLIDFTPPMKSTGRSLFSEISKTRTCETTGIPSSVCPCWHNKKQKVRKEDESSVILAAMKPIDYTLSKMGCVQSYKTEKPRGFRSFVLPFTNSIQEVEFDLPMTVKWDVGWETKFELKIRVNYDSTRRFARLLARPLVRSEWCDEKLIERVCRCIWRI